MSADLRYSCVNNGLLSHCVRPVSAFVQVDTINVNPSHMCAETGTTKQSKQVYLWEGGFVATNTFGVRLVML